MAFSYDHHAFLLDYAYLPTSPIGMPLLPQQAEELNTAPSCFLYPYPSAEMIPYVSGTDAKTYDRSSSPDSTTDAPSVDSTTCDSPKPGGPRSPEKKRKKKDDASCFATATSQDKDAEASKSCRDGKARTGLKETESKKRRAAASKGCGEDPAGGYIQVRARRGQATDSHSLAERVRREKISQRMKMLQGLVPGCEKVNGKAHMLDEIINYVQSLQNQVEFLSMRLASLSPMLYGFALDMNDYSNLQEKVMGREPQTTVPPADQRIQIEPTTSTGDASTNYHSVGNSAPHLLQGQGPNFPQDSGSSVMQVGEDRLLRQIQLVNMCSFQ